MTSSTKSAFTTDYKSIPGLFAVTDLSAGQFKVVKLLSTVGQIGLVSTSVLTSAVFVLMNDPKGTSSNPVAAEVAYQGIVKMLAGTSTIAMGDPLGINTTGQVVTTTTANRMTVGFSLGKSAAIGDIIPVVLQPGGQKY